MAFFLDHLGSADSARAILHGLTEVAPLIVIGSQSKVRYIVKYVAGIWATSAVATASAALATLIAFSQTPSAPPTLADSVIRTLYMLHLRNLRSVNTFTRPVLLM